MRIRDLARRMEIGVSRFYLVISRVRGELGSKLAAEIDGLDIEMAGIIPDDPRVSRFDEEGVPLVELPADSASLRAVRSIMERAGV